MKSFNLTTTQTLLALALAASASSAFAGGPSFDSSRVLTQGPALGGAAIAVSRPLPCSNPTTLTINTPTAGVANIDVLHDFSHQQPALGAPIFHQTTANKQFGYTFNFKMPEGCCEVSAGKLTVYYRAVQGGSSATSSDAGNDIGELIRNGVGSGGGPIYSSFPFAAGTTTVKTYTVPANWIASGRVSFIAEDDTAVDHATLTAQMCCVHMTPVTP
jgi:hypothetical protein